MPPLLAEFEQKLHEATSSDDDKSLPNVAVIAADSHGNILTSVASGTYIPKAPAVTSSKLGPAGVNTEPVAEKFTADTVCWIASCTKLMTSISAMQLVERGLINLDDDIAQTVLPEFKGIQVLTKMTDDGPILKPAKNKITLRNLLTHSSGLAYEFTHPKILAWSRWFKAQSKENRAKRRSSDPSVAYLVPLLFEPDTGGWAYGTSIDWVGIAVSRVSGLTLAEYMQKNIWNPLGMTSTTFYPEDRPDILPRMASMTTRDVEGKLQRGGPGGVIKIDIKESGGGGAFSTANDYIKLLIAILSNNGKLFKSQDTIPYMMSPHLKDPAHLAAIHANPMSYGLTGNLPQDTKLDYALGGLTNMTEVSTTGRAAGSMQWSGLPNLFWWINPKDGICGCYFGQLLPLGDVPSFKMYEEFEKAVNASFVPGKAEKEKL